MSNILKLYPSVEECRMKTNLVCPKEDCNRIFKTESNLTMHLAQSHENKELQKVAKSTCKQFYCPIVECYTIQRNKYFNSLRDLREHYLKVHTEKNVNCLKCKKGFPSITFMKRHFEYCGVKFACPSCKVSYESYETLKTHCRRKKHSCREKKEYLTNSKPCSLKQKPSVKVVSNKFLKTKPMFQPIFPNLGNAGPYILVLSTNNVCNKAEKCSQDSQTNIVIKAKLITRTTQVNNEYFAVTKRTQETQTGGKFSKISTSTQTETDQNLKPDILKKKDFVEGLDLVSSQKDIDIQTEKIEIAESSCNTSFNIDDFEFTETMMEKSSSSTQTVKKCEKDDFYSISTMTHDSIHTDTSDLLTEISHFDSNFFNCNMETQTDFMLNDDQLFDSDFYSNMYTQTCDEILSDMSNFTDIQTQTVVDDVLRSVESQTLMSKIGKIEASFTNMETQTDSEFREMLEIINS